MAQTRAVSNPPSWISRCAGVQKLSRPMVSCQEISQYKPMAIRMDALTQAQPVQGTRMPPASGAAFAAVIGAGKLLAEVFIQPPSSLRGYRIQDTLNNHSV